MAHFPDEDFCLKFEWKPYTGVGTIKCLHNTFLSLYFHGMVTWDAFIAAHATIASDTEHWIMLLWDRLRYARRIQNPECGDIVLLDYTKHCRIFVIGTTARYRFAEYSSNRGWLSLGCSARDWRPTFLHEFVSLTVVRDCLLSELLVFSAILPTEKSLALRVELFTCERGEWYWVLAGGREFYFFVDDPAEFGWTRYWCFGVGHRKLLWWHHEALELSFFDMGSTLKWEPILTIAE